MENFEKRIYSYEVTNLSRNKKHKETFQVEVSSEVYEVLEQSRKKENALKMQDYRHLSPIDYVGMETVRRIKTSPRPSSQREYIFSLLQADTAETVVRADMMQRVFQAIVQLSPAQKRRLIAYFFEELSYVQIAKNEGVSRQVVTRSIETAIKNIQKNI